MPSKHDLKHFAAKGYKRRWYNLDKPNTGGNNVRRIISSFLLSAFFILPATGGEDPLYDQIMKLDKKIFTAANTADLDTMKQMFSKDLEFYHDKGGLADYNQTISSLEELLSRPDRPTRTPVEGSMEVYPVKDYGAIQTGKHTFCHENNGKQDCGTFKFLHVWKNTDGDWKITRVMSYDH